MVPPTLADQVEKASNIIAVLLVLLTLFTANQASDLDRELTRDGGPKRRAVRQVAALTVFLCLLTAVSAGATFGLALRIVTSVGTSDWDPTTVIFDAVWVLLVFLFAWQVSIAVRSFASWNS